MVLRGLFSNLLSDTLQSLTRDDLDQVPTEEAGDVTPHAGWSDARRKFGTVSGAIIRVLSEAGSEMRLKDIHLEVDRMLGGGVSVHSVTDYICKRSKPPGPLFERTRRGYYRLLRLDVPLK
jgi:hypothetical protein